MADNNEKALDTDAWGRQLIEELARESLKERRARRRWRIFFILVFIGLIGLGMSRCSEDISNRGAARPNGPYVASIDIQGIISSESRRDEGVSAEQVIKALRRAYEDPQVSAVILRINSPGGSPVQAGMIVDEMRRLRRVNPDKALHAVIEEVGASGGYYIAAAADNIYVDKASLVGSIGVIQLTFGVQQLLDKLGVEPRMITAGKDKSFLNPFSPLKPEQKAHAQSMLDEIQKQFIDVVRTGRGNRLKESPEIYSGLVWTGARAVEMGLVDGLGSVDSVARDVLHAEDVVDFTEYSPWEQMFRQMGLSMVAGAWHKLDTLLSSSQYEVR